MTAVDTGCVGCQLPIASVRLYINGVAYSDGDLAACSSCVNSLPAPVTWDGTLEVKEKGACIYRNIPITEIDGKRLNNFDDIRLYHSPSGDSSLGEPGFCPPNDGVWILVVQCNTSTVCASNTSTMIWGGVLPTLSPLGFYRYYIGCVTDIPLIELRGL